LISFITNNYKIWLSEMSNGHDFHLIEKLEDII
jgi:hypothetical protein